MVSIVLDDAGSKRHFQLVKNKIQQRTREVLRLGYINKDKRKVYLNANCSFLLHLLLEDDFLFNIISVLPSELSDLINEIVSAFPDSIVDTQDSYKIIYNIFIDHGYNNPIFDKLDFIKNIGSDTCLYCNRNYIFTLNRIDKIKPEIDHFYPKSLYPFLGLSYYNLVPSCETCNGVNAKKDQDPRVSGLINPYLIKETDFKFTYSIASIAVVNPLSDLNSVRVKFKSKLQAHLDVFKLDKLYERHTDHVLELILKSKLKYTEHYRKYLKAYKELKFSDQEINRMIIGNYSTADEIHKRPLAKLYQDIAQELGLI